MKFTLFQLLPTFLTLCFISSCTDTSPIVIKDLKSSFAEEIEYGVSLVPPPNFTKAKSYFGFQAPNRGGSIELVVESDFESIKAKYSQKTIKSKRGEVLSHQTVEYGNSGEGFYVEYYDRPQRRLRQVLVVPKDGRVYVLKAFLLGKPGHPIAGDVKRSLLTTYIGKYGKAEKPFSASFVQDLENFKVSYTRDNKFPTEESDSLVVTVQIIDASDLHSDKWSFIEQKISKVCNGEIRRKRDELSNGYILKCSAICDTKSVLGVLLISEVEENVFIECVGNEKTDLKEVSTIILSKFVYAK